MKVKFSSSEADLRGIGNEPFNTKRKPSLFPTVGDLPTQRGKDKYGRKQSVMELSKKIYNLPKKMDIK